MAGAKEPRDLYLAFVSGSLSYDCRPCGKCCRGHGLGGDLTRIGQIPQVRRIAAFLDHDNTKGPLASFFTYADGCRYQGDDNLCDIHRAQGTAAKPRICRLFPFSKLVDLDDLWVVLPHERCPWRARDGGGPDPLSDHRAVLSDLSNEDGDFLSTVAPAVLLPVTPLACGDRRRLEERVRDALDLDALDGGAGRMVDTVAAIQEELGPGAYRRPADPELWLDMLRCAGPPPPLSARSERTFIAAIPALRVELSTTLPLAAVPNGLRAAALWLRSLAELKRRELCGEDLLSLLGHATPLLRLMALAEQPLPTLRPEAPTPLLEELWPELCDKAGAPLGTTLLALLRPMERGALGFMMQLGRLWPFVVGETSP